MKLTKSKLKQIIKEEMQKVLQESAEWPTLQELVGETQSSISSPRPEVNLAEMDFLDVLQAVAEGAALNSWMASGYDMESNDFPSDLFGKYGDELMQLQADSGEESYGLTPERVEAIISENYGEALGSHEEYERGQHYEQEYDLGREP